MDTKDAVATKEYRRNFSTSTCPAQNCAASPVAAVNKLFMGTCLPRSPGGPRTAFALRKLKVRERPGTPITELPVRLPAHSWNGDQAVSVASIAARSPPLHHQPRFFSARAARPFFGATWVRFVPSHTSVALRSVPCASPMAASEGASAIYGLCVHASSPGKYAAAEIDRPGQTQSSSHAALFRRWWRAATRPPGCTPLPDCPPAIASNCQRFTAHVARLEEDVARL